MTKMCNLDTLRGVFLFLLVQCTTESKVSPHQNKLHFKPLIFFAQAVETIFQLLKIIFSGYSYF